MNEILMTAAQIAERMAISKGTLYKSIKEGKFPQPLSIGGKDSRGHSRQARWPKSQIDEYIADLIANSQ